MYLSWPNCNFLTHEHQVWNMFPVLAYHVKHTKILSWWWHQIKRSRVHQSQQDWASVDHEFRKEISRQFIRHLSRNFRQNHKYEPHDGTWGKSRGSKSHLGLILWEAWISIQDLGSIHWKNIEWGCQIKIQRIKNIIRIRHPGTINVCANVHGDPSSRSVFQFGPDPFILF